jgi:DNA end-binding protein Ku
MAERLVDSMTQEWDPQRFHDTYREDLLARIENKIKSGQRHEWVETASEAAAAPRSGNVIDLVALLKQSIEKRAGTQPNAHKPSLAEKSAYKKTTARKTSGRKTATAASRRAGGGGRKRAA